ncbi:MAG: DHHA1 domain-containing protein, partial [Defluviitaleaceae bacterium]|nr:DHHA1 domain-containing protein [Defluviitaleaceae bacterium]
EYLMNTRGVEVALFLYERHSKNKDETEAGSADASENDATGCDTGSLPPSIEPRKIKVSMRSRGLHVGQVAASLGGGGHRMAAGCTIVGTIDDVLRQVLGILERELLDA